MKTHNPVLIEAIKTGFKICYENESSHNLQLLVNALNTQKPYFFYSETYHGPDAADYQYECETESANIKNNTIVINVYRKSGHDYTWDNA